MKAVSTKEEFNRALEEKESQILVTGELAKSMRRRSKAKKASVGVAVALIIGGIVAIPFTGGASSGLAAMGAAALTVGTVTISTAELAILCGFVLGMTAILTGAKVEFLPDGTVIVTPNYKS